MKKLFTVLCLCISICAVAQSDTADLRAGATDMVFYNASTGTKTNASNLDWHLAFGVRSAIPPYKTNQAAAIRINEAIGVELYKSPSQKVSGWNSFDTTGWRGWQRMHNPDTTWTIGALNINKDFGNDYNYGWGAYSFGSHSVVGDSSVYLLKMPDGSFRKLAILNLQYDTAFNFLYDKLDNSDYTAAQVRKRLFSNKMFAYYSLDTKTATDKEPAISDWDMVFTRYNNTTYDPGNLSQDMGILTNDSRITGTEVSSTATQPCYYGAFSTYINTIGKSWMQSTTPDSLTYYLADATTSQTAFRFVMNYFGGSYTGKMAFTTTASACATGIAELNTSEALTVYPVPAVNALHMRLTSESGYDTEVAVTDIAGRTLLTKDYQVTAGQNDIEMNTSALSAGNYIITINTTAGKVSRMISVVR
ncbi:MAG: T9SS type A sorting domain-containing protein [Bacteroidetes bacterium]|nr:T9SS type A sorting domain-containing protein [Bacteroidota bacterium]